MTTYSHVSFFGDSLTDVANIYNISLEGEELRARRTLPGLYDDAGYAAYAANKVEAKYGPRMGDELAYSNEYTFVNYAAQSGGFAFDNYGIGGAYAVGERILYRKDLDLDGNLGGQIDRYLADTAGDTTDNDASFVFIGLQDLDDTLRASLSAGPQALIDSAAQTTAAIVTNLEQAANDLSDGGVDTVFLATMPKVDFFPAFGALPGVLLDAADTAIKHHNDEIADLAEEMTAAGTDVRLVDMSALSWAITDDYNSFGIIGEPTDYARLNKVGADDDQLAFWDPIHPAEPVHQAWGAFASFIMNGGKSVNMRAGSGTYVDDGGDSVIMGMSGHDSIEGARGNDVLIGGSGMDTMSGGYGEDILSGGNGSDMLHGKHDNDILNGGYANDSVYGNGGDDVLIDGVGEDHHDGGIGDDILIFIDPEFLGSHQKSDVFQGADGNDTLYLVLDSDDYATFTGGDQDSVIDAMGLDIRNIEQVVAIDGTENVENVLGHYDWFQAADMWGLIPAT